MRTRNPGKQTKRDRHRKKDSQKEASRINKIQFGDKGTNEQSMRKRMRKSARERESVHEIGKDKDKENENETEIRQRL